MARLLINRGFKLVRPLQGGFDAWVAAGYDVEPLEILARREAGLQPKEVEAQPRS